MSPARASQMTPLHFTMKQYQNTEYTFQSYSVWAGIAFLLFLIPGTFGLVTLFKALGLASLHESIIKAILVP
jgi:hypothetical protein